MGRTLSQSARHAMVYWKPGEIKVLSGPDITIQTEAPFEVEVPLNANTLRTLLKSGHLAVELKSGDWRTGREISDHDLWSLHNRRFRRTDKRFRKFKALIRPEESEGPLPESRYHHDMRMRLPNKYTTWLSWLENLGDDNAQIPRAPLTTTEFLSALDATEAATPSYRRWALATHQLGIVNGKLVRRDADEAGEDAIQLATPLFQLVNDPTLNITIKVPNRAISGWRPAGLGSMLSAVTFDQYVLQRLQYGQRITMEGTSMFVDMLPHMEAQEAYMQAAEDAIRRSQEAGLVLCP